MTPQSFGDFLARRVAASWCIASRSTPRLREKYAVVITPKQYAALQREWEVQTYGAPLDTLRDAAPELLAALTRSRAQWIHSVNAPVCLAAIAKAEGRPCPSDTSNS